MKVLNLGCGGNRPTDERWVNIDNLHAIFPDLDRPERKNMDAEPNYLNADLRNGIPFEDGSVDGILASHFFEHLDAQEALVMVRECHRVLRPGGILRISIPDVKKFHELSVAGCKDWGEPNGTPEKSFMEYALLFIEHKQLLGLDALYCLFWLAGFSDYSEIGGKETQLPPLADIDNRAIFSLFVEATK